MSLISTIAPRWALKRAIAREQLRDIRKRSAHYAAAQSNRLTGSWSPTTEDVNELIGNSSPQVRARVRQLVRDFPYFARAVDIITGYTVGAGIQFQSRVTSPDGNLNARIIENIESAFYPWADTADIGGRLHFNEIMQLAKRQDLEAGEFLIVKHFKQNKPVPLALQIVEPDNLSDIGATAKNPRHSISQGIEYDPATGRIIAYHLQDPNAYYKTTRYPASRIIHGFHTLRPQQLRGISPFAPAVLVAHDLGEYMDATMDTAKMASKYLAFVKRIDPYSAQVANVAYDSDTSQPIETLQNAIIEYLQPGEDVQFASPANPGAQFGPFVKLILTMISVTVGVPYELLSGDYAGVNYSTMRTTRNDFSHYLRPIIDRHIRHFCNPVLSAFMDAAIMSGQLSLPGYLKNQARYLAADWQGPGMESIDPAKEGQGNIDQIAAGLKSPQEVAKTRGKDLEQIYQELASAKTLASKYGLDFTPSTPSTPATTQPEENQDEPDNA